MIFTPCPLRNWTEIDKQNLWNRLVKENKVLFDPKDDKTKVNNDILRQYLNGGSFRLFPTIEEDPAFQDKCNEYKSAWEAFKPTMIQTDKNYTVKEK